MTVMWHMRYPCHSHSPAAAAAAAALDGLMCHPQPLELAAEFKPLQKDREALP
jgi:hypothetical protein